MVSSSDVVQQLTVGEPGQTSTFILTNESLLVTRQGDKKWPKIESPFRHVIWAELVGNALEVSVLARKTKGSFALVHITGAIQDAQKETSAKFVNALMDASYQGVKRPRHLKVFVNPHSGPGKAVSIYKKKVEPLFRATRCITDVTFTTHAKHATEIVKDLPLDKYDAIVTMSGDGLIHEVLNGLAEHADPLGALRTPIAPVPTGSGNGLSYNLLGLQEGGDVFAAALNAAKGLPMPIDLFSMTQKDKRVFSFMSQSIGLMAELDLGTEHLRFMGSGRFVYGFLRGIVKNKACPVKLQIKVSESDKKAMVRNLHAARSEIAASKPNEEVYPESTSGNTSDSPGVTSESTPSGSTISSLPELKYTTENPEGDGWVTFEKPVLYLYAGKGPYVGRNLMQFPVSLPDDGYIDVVVQEQATRGDMLKAMDGAEKGQQYWMPSQHYFKAKAYRVEPHSSSSCLSVDGEKYPFEPYQIEVHKGLGMLLSPYGYYNADFDMPE